MVSLNVLSQVSFGDANLINDQWNFQLVDSKEQIPTNNWTPVDLPHDWSVKGQMSEDLASCTGYLPGGIGWYQKVIDIPNDKNGQRVFIFFEGVYNRSEVFINNQSVGYRPNGYISFMYDITNHVKFGETNEIKVKVDHSQSADSRWYTGSGIYRNVWLVYSNPVHFNQWGVFAYLKEIDHNKASLIVDAEIANQSGSDATVQVINTLVDANGKVVSEKNSIVKVNKDEKNKAIIELDVENPQKWSLEKPFLYELRTQLIQNGKVIDKTSTKTGIRTFTFNPNKGMALNGEWIKIKGVCIHHDAGVLGAAVPHEVWKSRLATLKEMGCNAIRTSHNPQATDLYDLCDEMGFLVMDEAFDEWEFPKRKWLDGWNVGTPGFQGSFDFFEEWSSKDITDMVRRDRNHPCIFTWSIGNEVDYPNDPYSHPILNGAKINQPMFGGYKPDSPDANRLGAIAKRLVAEVKKQDTSRAVTAALAGVVMSNETEYPGALDITGYNYTENRYETDHKKYPNRVIYGSENGHSMDAWKAVRDNNYIFGQFLWTGLDYLGEAGKWPSRGLNTGLIDFTGALKPRGYFRKSLWSDQPMAYIGTYPKPRRDRKSIDARSTWEYEDGQMIRVVCYTNTSSAKLLLNGNEVGEMKPYDDKTGIISWDILFKKGKLEVVGFDKDGKQTTSYAITTPYKATQIIATTNESIVDKNKGLAIVELEIQDSTNVRVMSSNVEITCDIVGPGKLLGLEAGSNTDMSDYTDNKQNAYNGRLIAYVQMTGEKGEVKVQFTSPGLAPSAISITSK